VSEATEDGDVLNRAGMLAGRIADNSAVAVQQCIRTLRMKEVSHSVLCDIAICLCYLLR
jgi:hypothetical protein